MKSLYKFLAKGFKCRETWEATLCALTPEGNAPTVGANEDYDPRKRKGKRGAKVQMSELLDKVALMGQQQVAHKKFVSYSGRKDEDSCEFLKQFNSIEVDMTDNAYLALVRNHLTAAALNWYKGSEVYLFNDKESFLYEFNAFFRKDKSRATFS
ncbi:hypothetical protein ENBRE01_2922 [Enteropsectra breve]|nr:hypothetical protein ENBRE01_2922 [Enteropsectra breve]